MIHRLFDRLLRAYARVTPTSRGGYRLARLARRLHRQPTGLFEPARGIHMGLDLNVYPDCSMAYGLFEVETVRVVRRILRAGDTFIDGGANIGYFTLIAAQILGPKGRVHAFEPQPENVVRLQRNIRENGFADTVSVHSVALGDRAGEMQLHTYGAASENHALSTFFATPGTETRSVTVGVVRLDDYLVDVAPRLIKLDIEGAEPLAVAGMVETLRKHRPAVIVEVNAGALARGGHSPADLLERLRSAVPTYQAELIGRPGVVLRDLTLRSDSNILLTDRDAAL